MNLTCLEPFMIANVQINEAANHIFCSYTSKSLLIMREAIRNVTAHLPTADIAHVLIPNFHTGRKFSYCCFLT